MSISPSLIAALIAVESGGDPAALGDRGDAVGILQIHKCVVTDVNQHYGTHYVWPDDCYDPQKSEDMADKYLSWWGRPSRFGGQQATDEQLARIWNGGPNGFRKEATAPYWEKVKSEIKTHE